jgi:hypothetical protein
MTAYRILLADPLLALGPQWPEGCHLAGRLEPGPAGTHWWSFEDPQAPAELEGKRVEIVTRRDDDGRPQIAGRYEIVVHQSPAEEGKPLPCCGAAVPSLPRGHQMTLILDRVTCGRREVVPS